jgi:hypothetical protein
VEHLVGSELDRSAGIGFDRINYLRAGEDYPPLPGTFERPDDYLQGLRAVSRPGTPFVAILTDQEANLAYLRVRMRSGKDVVATGVINRWHDDISFMLREEKHLDSRRDVLEFQPGMIGSYPNMFFDVHQDDVPAFLRLLATFDGGEESRRQLARFAINRGDERFWDTYDWFQRRFDEDEPIRGGLLDLNRYFHQAN